VVWEPPRVRAVAESAMREALLGKDNPADVINVALEQLAQQRCELPAYSESGKTVGGRCGGQPLGAWGRPIDKKLSMSRPYATLGGDPLRS
jgi:hypothetical protein